MQYNYGDYCDSVKIQAIKTALENSLIEIKKLDTPGINKKSIANNMENINSTIDFSCLSYLALNNRGAGFLQDQLKIGTTQLKLIGRTSTLKNCVPHINDLLGYLQNFQSNSYSEKHSEKHSEKPSKKRTFEETPDKETQSSTKQVRKSLFPDHKYLDISDVSEFDEVKAKYRQLAKMYHTDHCPNENTPNMSVDDCKQVMQKLNEEYETIKKRFNKSGGKTNKKKKTKKRYSTKSNRKYKNKKSMKRFRKYK